MLCIHLFLEPRRETDEFVRVVTPKTAHRIGKQNVHHAGRKGSGSCCIIRESGITTVHSSCLGNQQYIRRGFGRTDFSVRSYRLLGCAIDRNPSVSFAWQFSCRQYRPTSLALCRFHICLLQLSLQARSAQSACFSAVALQKVMTAGWTIEFCVGHRVAV